MVKLLRWTIFFASAPLLTIAANDDPFTRYLHPDAKFLMGIEMKRIANSPIGGMLRKQLQESTPIPGLEFVAEVDRVLISSPGKRTAEKDSSPDKNTKATAGDAPILMVIAGRFNLQKLKELAATEGEMLARYGAVELIAPTHGKTTSMHFGLISPALILAGDAISLREAIDRSTLPLAPLANPGLLQRATALAGVSEVWMTAALSPTDFSMESVPAAAMFSDVRGMEMAMGLQEGLGMRLTLNARNAAAAGKLAGGILALTQLVGAQGGRSGAADLMKSLSVKNEGSRVTVSLAMDATTLERGIAQIRTSVRQSASSQAPPTNTPSRTGIAITPGPSTVGSPVAARKQPEQPPQKLMIRIVGAEGGPIEIPFETPAPVKP